MKKSLVVLLALGAILTARTASATAVDFGDVATPGSLAYIIQNTVGDDDDQNGGVAGAALAPNGMLDRAEVHLVMAYLSNASALNHDQIHTAWNTNLARANTDVLIASYRPAVAMYMTLGDALTVQSIVAFLAFYGMTANPANYDLTCAGLLGPDGDADADGYTNKEEYLAATASLNLTGPWADNATRDAQRALAVTNHVAAASVPNATSLAVTIVSAPARNSFITGESVTFTASSVGATGAVTYEWFKGATSVGTGATLTIAAIDAADAGSYTAVGTDSSTPLAQHDTSNVLSFSVIDSASLPVMGVAGMALLVGLAGALGVRKIRK